MVNDGDRVLLADGLVHTVLKNWRRPAEESVFVFDIPCQRESVVAYKTAVQVTQAAITCMTCLCKL
jgi:hypothetical protein